MLVLERPGTVKNYIYKAGQNISIKTKKGEKINGPINMIIDSSLIVDFVHELEIDDIEFVYKQRQLLNTFGNFAMGGSAMYIGFDAINGGYRNKNLAEDTNFLVASGIFVSGLIMNIFSKKKMRIDNEKWRIKILKE
jgi:hypothetical protein